MIFEDWGLIPYGEALNKQLSYLEKLDAALSKGENHPGFLIFCTHPAVVTTGRQTKPDDIFSWTGDVIEISRGGRATYHGPSQIVVYPIINLKNPRKSRGAQEIRGYLRDFEKAIALTLKEFGIEAVGKTPQKIPGEQAESDETGVWVGSQKIASLGIAVKKWMSYHGAAINFLDDASAFVGINPCGFKTDTMISVEKKCSELSLTKPDIELFKTSLKKHLSQLL